MKNELNLDLQAEALKHHVSSETHVISLWINCYDDIFSDFDLRPYSVRNVSDDFLQEVKKLAHESDNAVYELKLFMPAEAREHISEISISKRLHSHFVKNQHYFLKKKKNERKSDVLFIFIGIAMMTCASFVSSVKSDNFFLHPLLMIIEPAGWFLVWTGMGNIIGAKRVERPEFNFYTKMIKSKVTFLNV